MEIIFGISVTTVCLILCLVLILCWWIQQNHITKRGVPRVPDIPVIGSLPWVGSLQEFSEHVGKSFHKLSYKYGPVFYFKLIGLDMVVVNGYEAVKEVLGSKGIDFAGRAEEFQLIKKHQNTMGIFDGDYNEGWKDQRRFLLQNLRMFGFGKRRFEGNILEETQCLLKALEAHDSKPFNFRPYASNCVSNVICSMIFGERYDYDDKNFIFLSDTLNTYLVARAQPPIGELQWYLKWMPSAKNHRKKLSKLSDMFFEFFQTKIDEHLNTFDKNNLRDVIDGYLQEISDNPKTVFTVEQLKRIIFEIFVGGSETSSTFMQWSMIYMANHQSVQDKVKAELDAVFGDQMPSLHERQNLPYTEAVLQELKRIASVITVTGFHKALKDTDIRGIPVKKNTMIAVNLYSVLHDPVLFPEPEQFRPERFLTDDMKFVRNEHVIPFGLGPRVCLGQQLAKQELFLFFTNIIHRFRITPPPGVDAIPINGATRISFHPKSFEICAKPYH